MQLLFAIGGIEIYLSNQLSATQDFSPIPDSRFPIPDSLKPKNLQLTQFKEDARRRT
ncbi:hypothetical protein [Moorena producens]|uniref:hypothetical protein n=1 Tax=Moorena producens TaxID=1155739 RepID=UPI003C76DF90